MGQEGTCNPLLFSSRECVIFPSFVPPMLLKLNRKSIQRCSFKKRETKEKDTANPIFTPIFKCAHKSQGAASANVRYNSIKISLPLTKILEFVELITVRAPISVRHV